LRNRLKHVDTPEQPRWERSSRLLGWKEGHSNAQGLAVAGMPRRSPLSQPPGTAGDRRNAAAAGDHAPSHPSVAESLGAQSRARAAAPRGRSKKKRSRRGPSSVSRLLWRLLVSTYAQRGCNHTGACGRSWPCCRSRCTPSGPSIPTLTFLWCLTASRRCVVACQRSFLRPCGGARR
jgi:hypothetical protein